MLIDSILATATPSQQGLPQAGKSADVNATSFSQLMKNMGGNLKPALSEGHEKQGVMPGISAELLDQPVLSSGQQAGADQSLSLDQPAMALQNIPTADVHVDVEVNANEIKVPTEALPQRDQADNEKIRPDIEGQRATVSPSPLSQSIMQSIGYINTIRDNAANMPIETRFNDKAPVYVPLVVNADKPMTSDLLPDQPRIADEKTSALNASNQTALPERSQLNKAPVIIQAASADPTAPMQAADGSRIITGSGVVSPTTGSAQLSSPVATEQWGKELGRQLIQMTRSGNQQMELRLNPVELGPLSISLKMSDSNSQAQAQFLSHNPLVRQALEVALPQLRESLSEQGITLNQSDVSDKGSEAFAGNGQGQQSGSAKSISTGPEEIEAGQVAEAVTPAHDGLISTYA